MKKILLACLPFALFSCVKEPLTSQSQGQIKVFVCSRGCYQYLLETDGGLYFPDFVPDDLKVDGQSVLFHGEPLEGTTLVYKEAANDALLPDFEAPNLHILDMQAQ